MEELKKYWVAFNLVKGIGSVRMRGLLDYFGSAEAAWKAPQMALISTGLSQKLVEGILQTRASDRLEKTWERIASLELTVLTWEDETYPRLLREIDQPPPVMYVRGKLQAEDEWAVSVVGTRRMTVYGRQVAEDLAGYLAQHGVTVVSGLARGVDTAAHGAALKAGGRTLAVLGCGLDQIYPPENQRLAGNILSHGALISDYPPGTPPEAGNFPPRNRIISGLTRAVVIIEAGQTSGALITASFAADQGREVFAVPGPIHAPSSKGTNSLIQQGARPLLDFDELLETLNLERATEQRAARTILPADAAEAQLYSLLGCEPTHIDEICAQTHFPVEKVSSTLAMMELKGLVRQVGGMCFVAVAEPSADYLA